MFDKIISVLKTVFLVDAIVKKLKKKKKTTVDSVAKTIIAESVKRGFNSGK